MCKSLTSGLRHPALPRLDVVCPVTQVTPVTLFWRKMINTGDFLLVEVADLANNSRNKSCDFMIAPQIFGS